MTGAACPRKGIKLALFDVSDVEHPKQIDKVEIGDAGSDSAALSDHKAFLFDKAEEPARDPGPGREEPGSGHRYKECDSAEHLVRGVRLRCHTRDRLYPQGTVEHGTGSDRYYCYGSSQNEVKRSLYIGDVLYTLSSKKILANSLSNINTTIATINLPGWDDVLYPVIMLKGME